MFKSISIILAILTVSVIGFPRMTYAQTCGGGNAGKVYYGAFRTNCTPANCDPQKDSPCSCTQSCPADHGGQIVEFCSDYTNNCTACAGLNMDKAAFDCTSGTCSWNGVAGASCGMCYTGWQNVSCGGGSCTNSQMQQRNVASGSTGICSTQWRCVSSGACAPGPTATPVPPDPKAPANLAGSCNVSNTVNLSWTPDANATYYALRVDNTTTGGWDGSCSGGGDFCANVGPASYSFTGVLNNNYNWWVHSCNSSMCSASTTGPSFSCLGAPATPTPVPPTATPTPTPTLVPPPTPYFKVKDTSFFKLGDLNLTFPTLANMVAYDASDTVAGGYFDQGESGVVVASGSTITAGVGGSAISGSVGNARNWTKTGFAVSSPFTSTSYISYINSKKSAVSIANISAIPAGSGATYSLATTPMTTINAALTVPTYTTIIVNGDLTLSTSDIGQEGTVFIVKGNVVVNGSGAVPTKFNGTNRTFALFSSGSITFDNNLTEADGLYVGGSVNFGSGTTPLKIVGNVSSAAPSAFSRDRQNNQPSMFIVFDPKHYINIIDKVSVIKSSWTQIQ